MKDGAEASWNDAREVKGKVRADAEFSQVLPGPNGRAFFDLVCFPTPKWEA